MYHEVGPDQGIKNHFKDHPKHAFGSKGGLNVKRIYALFKSLEEAETIPEKAPLSLSDFKKIEKIETWLANECQPTGLLVGPAGCSKSLFGKAITEHNRLKMLSVQHPDSLKRLKKDNNMIFYDDVNFEKIDRQQLIALLETDKASQIRVLYDIVEKPAKIVQLIALNLDALKRLKLKLEALQLLRRLVIMPVSGDFTVNINNINLHYHAHIYNNHDTINRNKNILET